MSYGNEAVRPGSEPQYGAKWSSNGENPTRQRLRREIYGDDYPIEANPRGYVTLNRFSSEARAQTTELITNDD